MELHNILQSLGSLSPSDHELISHAYEFAKETHKGQLRFSGEPYIIHPLAVAEILAEQDADAKTIAAGLLHDCLDDYPEKREQLKREFGPEIFLLVDGVTKLGHLKYKGLERHAESLRKLFIAMAKDIRVMLIRLADRLHNVRTLAFVPEEKRERIALETIDIYAPLANRLGMGQLKEALEDGAFPFVYPEEYTLVKNLLKQKKHETELRLQKMYRSLTRNLANAGVQDYKIDYRVKGLYSLYKKLRRHGMDIEKVYDIIALRVIVSSISDCYQVLGIIHAQWKPAPERIKDYIATPKPNGYQSIHTSVFSGDGAVAEIQIRTFAMHHEAEYGVASHVGYEEMGKNKRPWKISQKLSWIQELLRLQREYHENEEFLENLKMDFFQDRIFVFTPKGDVVELPEGASALDFAYSIHSDIGDHASAATVSGKYVSLDHKLKSGDIVHIETKKTSRPSHKWLDYVKTSMARKNIRISLSQKTTQKKESNA